MFRSLSKILSVALSYCVLASCYLATDKPLMPDADKVAYLDGYSSGTFYTQDRTDPQKWEKDGETTKNFFPDVVAAQRAESDAHERARLAYVKRRESLGDAAGEYPVFEKSADLKRKIEATTTFRIQKAGKSYKFGETLISFGDLPLTSEVMFEARLGAPEGNGHLYIYGIAKLISGDRLVISLPRPDDLPFRLHMEHDCVQKDYQVSCPNLDTYEEFQEAVRTSADYDHYIQLRR